MVQILVQLLVQILVQILYKSWYKFSQSEENNILWGVHIFVTFWNVFPADYKCRNCCLTAWLKINCVQNARRAHMFRVVDVDGDVRLCAPLLLIQHGVGAGKNNNSKKNGV